ncbi:uncharacterized protein LOC110446929 [Mizuhopecten yessoensis]|uniref:TIR domain-containing protein n=1 Tax=Mizuhopecten yessoensis TaxID=6573 RepID=A0A210QWA9_MIZYE|nr:uncharacterized protein LOC110446929 [Mizuhopecten yessoensis]OWF53049.1 hypothetical protein KP79_PYT08151 [Mizuhopecten yessoensis]
MACSKCPLMRQASLKKYRNLKVLPVGKCYHATFIHDHSLRCKAWVHTATTELTKEGFRCFDLARDSIPKLSAQKQKIEAFKRSKTVIVLLTEKCLKNRTFQRDLDMLTADNILNNDGNLHEKILPLWLDIVKLPDSLSYVQPLDASSSRDIWWDRLVCAIDFDRVDNITSDADDDLLINPVCEEIEQMANKLRLLGSRQISSLLLRPVFLELYHFLAQCADERVLLAVMESNGVYIVDRGKYPVGLRCALESCDQDMDNDQLRYMYKRDAPSGAWMHLDTSFGKWKRIEINMCMLWNLPDNCYTETIFVKIPQVRDMVFVVHADFKQQIVSDPQTCEQCRYSRGESQYIEYKEEECLTLILEKRVGKHAYAYYFVPFCGPDKDALDDAKVMLNL